MEVDEDHNEGPAFGVSEDLVQSPVHKMAQTSTLDFNGLLEQPLKLHEDLRGGCGGQLWPAGIVLAKYLLRQHKRDMLQSKTILELGAGGGLVGIALAVAFAVSQAFLTDSSSRHVHITDQVPMLALMQKNIELNALPPELIHASVLDWGSSTDLTCPDILLAADCVYFEPAFPLLLDTMVKLIGPKTTCYFCFKKRRRADLRFIKDARKMFLVKHVLDDPDMETWRMEGLFMFKISQKLTV